MSTVELSTLRLPTAQVGIDPLPLPNQPVPRRLRERATQASSPGIGQRIGQSVGPRIDHRHAHSWT